ncbi:RES family NAD+ phosphorylase [Luteolibacter algae]|uniref:RES family NAD+ phosphorylase n=1 Tax=Luteolibacter algae TaxID=454151 RepID=A0ABW5D937_9BACT
MPLFYRICQSQWVGTAMSGEGARLYGGRWNPPGMPAVYLAESRALAALEIVVHASPQSLLLDWSIIEVEVPEKLIDNVDPDDLPRGWSLQPSSPSARKFGGDWLSGRFNLAIRLPSSIIREEYALLLNPNVEKMSSLKISKPRKFLFDSRLSYGDH